MATAYSGSIYHGTGDPNYPRSEFDLEISYTVTSSGISWSAYAVGTYVSLYGSYSHYLTLVLTVNGTNYTMISGDLLGYRSSSQGSYNAQSCSGSISTPFVSSGATFTVTSTFNQGNSDSSTHALSLGTDTQEPAKYTLTVRAGTGISAVSGGGTVNQGTSKQITATVATGYTWSKWQYTSSGSQYSTSRTVNVTVNSNIDLTAVATPNAYTITFNKGSYGTGSNTTLTKYYNQQLVLLGRIFTRTGYVQDGWSTSQAGTTKAYDLSGIFPASTNSNTTLYPYWVAESSGGSGTTIKTGTQPYLYANSKWNKVLPWVMKDNRWYPCGAEGGVPDVPSSGGGTGGGTTTTNGYTVASAGAQYTFAQNASGYYESNNKGVNNSCALAKVTITTDGTKYIAFDCISYAEAYCDYGILSTVGGTLSTTYDADTTNVKQSFYSYNSGGVRRVSYGKLAAGTHTIYVKFRKEQSVHKYNDSFQFKVQFLSSDTALVPSTYSFATVGSYGFVKNPQSTDWYFPTNMNQHNTAAVSKITIVANGVDNIYIDAYQKSEYNYDYGLISNDGSTLSTSAAADSSGVKTNLKGNTGASVFTTNFGVLSAGTHTIYIKYFKDGSQHSNGDYCQFAVRLNSTAFAAPSAPTSSYYVGSYNTDTYHFNHYDTGWYVSTNTFQPSTYSYGLIGIQANGVDPLYIDCYCCGEARYDYGILSNLDTALVHSNAADTANVKQSFQNLSTYTVHTVDYGIPTAGSHTITVKYIKDHSQDDPEDTFKFLVRYNGSQSSPPSAG